MSEMYMGTVGLSTGLVDQHGIPIHLGDTLVFDEREWGAPYPANEFVIEFKDGELLVFGCVSELRQFCTVTKKWDGRRVLLDLSVPALTHPVQSSQTPPAQAPKQQ